MVRPPSYVRTFDSYSNTELKKAHSILYKPYRFLEHPSSVLEYPGSRLLYSIENLIASGRFQEARHHSHELIKTTLGGISYLETYDRTLLRAIVTFAYTGWIAFSAAYILVLSRPPLVSSLWITLFFSTATVASCVFFAIQRLPWTLHIYILFPFYFWHEVAIRLSVMSSVIRNHKLGTNWIANAALGLVLAVAALQSMVVRRIAPSLPPCESQTSPEVWIQQPSSLERWFRHYWARVALNVLAGRQREVLWVVGCFVSSHRSIPIASCGPF